MRGWKGTHGIERREGTCLYPDFWDLLQVKKTVDEWMNHKNINCNPLKVLEFSIQKFSIYKNLESLYKYSWYILRGPFTPRKVIKIVEY